MDIISSIDNPQIKVLRSLSEKKFRKFHGQYVVEGVKCVREAIYSGANITKLFVSESKQERKRATNTVDTAVTFSEVKHHFIKNTNCYIRDISPKQQKSP